MKIVIAPQTFKGNLSGMEVSKAIGAGVAQVFPNAELIYIPVADGGDGTVDALVESSGGEFYETVVKGPLIKEVSATWGVMGDGETAVIEMARASGLVLVPPHLRDPRRTTTYGTGQLIQEALGKGYKKIIIGIGGSATNDGGAGMAQALGAKLLDVEGAEIEFGGLALDKLVSIDMSEFSELAREAHVVIATDVNNPLCGEKGASAVYGPQKGATPTIVRELDSALEKYAMVVKTDIAADVRDIPGAGAAGGLGAGLMAFLGAETHSGIDLVCDVLNLDQHLEGADVVITGEGSVDSSTVYNKAPVGVAKRAKQFNIPVIVVAGILGVGYGAVYDHGIDGIVSIQHRPMSMKASLRESRQLLTESISRAMRLVKIGRSVNI